MTDDKCDSSSTAEVFNLAGLVEDIYGHAKIWMFQTSPVTSIDQIWSNFNGVIVSKVNSR